MQKEVKLPVWRHITSSSLYCYLFTPGCINEAFVANELCLRCLLNVQDGVRINGRPEFFVSAIPRKSRFEHQCLSICHRP